MTVYYAYRTINFSNIPIFNMITLLVLYKRLIKHFMFIFFLTLIWIHILIENLNIIGRISIDIYDTLCILSIIFIVYSSLLEIFI